MTTEDIQKMIETGVQKLIRDKTLWEDVIQDVWVIFLAANPGPERELCWVVIRNALIDTVRRLKGPKLDMYRKTQEVTEEDQVTSETPFIGLASFRGSDLGQRRQALIVKRLSEGYRPSEIARQLNVSQQAIHGYVLRLRKVYNEAGPVSWNRTCACCGGTFELGSTSPVTRVYCSEACGLTRGSRRRVKMQACA